MTVVRLIHDRHGDTLTVWFDEPASEVVCEEVADEVVLMKNEGGRVIGLEKLNLLATDADHEVHFETSSFG